MGLEFMAVQQRAADILRQGIYLQRNKLRSLLALSLFTVYLIVGASIYSAIETPDEQRYLDRMRKYLDQFTEEHKQCLSGKAADPQTRERGLHMEHFDLHRQHKM
ncbi:unnamed protein product [Soboliphyme baturini]|uniref:Potassium channel subfamily K member 9 n=1 Tax=Soboliphyme baturini TaxID=241478 RepID=A0A183J518_9BILA|nr:unnamed protein product [Soboliphyme baturini]